MSFRDGYWCVRDLGSRNGIRVDDERVYEAWLMPGSTVRIAKLRFEIDYVPQSDELPPPLDPTASGSLLEKAVLAKELERDPDPDWLRSDQDHEPNQRIDLASL